MKSTKDITMKLLVSFLLLGSLTSIAKTGESIDIDSYSKIQNCREKALNGAETKIKSSLVYELSSSDRLGCPVGIVINEDGNRAMTMQSKAYQLDMIMQPSCYFKGQGKTIICDINN